MWIIFSFLFLHFLFVVFFTSFLLTKQPSRIQEGPVESETAGGEMKSAIWNNGFWREADCVTMGHRWGLQVQISDAFINWKLFQLSSRTCFCPAAEREKKRDGQKKRSQLALSYGTRKKRENDWIISKSHTDHHHILHVSFIAVDKCMMYKDMLMFRSRHIVFLLWKLVWQRLILETQ